MTDIFIFFPQSDRLVEAFGSTKRKKAMKTRLQNVIDSEELGQSVSTAVNHMMRQPEENGGKGNQNRSIQTNWQLLYPS